MEKIKVVLWGIGAMGSGIGKILLNRKGIEIVGAIDNMASKVGKDLGELLDLKEKTGIKVTDNPEEAINSDVDIVMHATSYLNKDEFEFLLKKKVNVITTIAEISYPGAKDPDLATWLDDLAKKNEVAILGTGINPGFVLDLLIITLTGACSSVEKIEASRVNDLSPFGHTVMKDQGVGISVEEFRRGVEEGKIMGHYAFPESLYMIADRIGLEIDEIKETIEPIISKTIRETKYVKIEPGMVAGCKHTARGFKDGKEVIVLEHPQQVFPEKEGTETGDYINIFGDPDIKMAIKPEIPGGVGTMAVAVNMIPQVLNSRAGLVTMADLPTPGVIMSDVRNLLRNK